MVLRSTARAVSEIEASGGGLLRGAAIIAVSTSAAMPATARTQPASFTPQRSSGRILNAPRGNGPTWFDGGTKWPAD